MGSVGVRKSLSRLRKFGADILHPEGVQRGPDARVIWTSESFGSKSSANNKQRQNIESFLQELASVYEKTYGIELVNGSGETVIKGRPYFKDLCLRAPSFFDRKWATCKGSWNGTYGDFVLESFRNLLPVVNLPKVPRFKEFLNEINNLARPLLTLPAAPAASSA